jgi:hypothetical protein
MSVNQVHAKTAEHVKIWKTDIIVFAPQDTLVMAVKVMWMSVVLVLATTVGLVRTW